MSSVVSTRRAAVLAGVVLLSVLLGWLLVVTLGDEDGSAAPGGAAASTDDPSGAGEAGTAGGSGDGTGTATDDGTSADDDQGSDGSDGSDGSADGAATSNAPPKGGTVVEHRPADADETAAPQPGEKGFHLPGLNGTRPPKYLIDQAPDADRATGSVVAGYPVAYLRLPKAADVDASEVSSQGTRVQAVLEATCDCAVADVVAFHDKTLARLGLAGKAVAATGGSTARSYRDQNDAVTLTVRRDGNETTYTLYSVITAARA